MSLSFENMVMLLKPIAGFSRRRAIKYQEIQEALKQALVRVAQEELETNGIAISISKLSAMTGLQRPDVVRLLAVESETPKRSILARVLGHWAGTRRFRDRDGRPRLLSYAGKHSDFWKLVLTVSRELNPYAVLFDLKRLGLVQEEKEGLRLISTITVDPKNVDHSLGLLAEDVQDLVAAVEENTFASPDVPNLHLRVQYDNIPPKELQKLRRWCLEEGSKFIARAQAQFARHDRDLNESLADLPGDGRVMLGVFAVTKEPPKPRP